MALKSPTWLIQSFIESLNIIGEVFRMASRPIYYDVHLLFHYRRWTEVGVNKFLSD